MKFFYGFLVLALFAAAQGAPTDVQPAVAAPAVATVEEPKPVDEKKTGVATVEEDDDEKKADNNALNTINNILEAIIDSNVLGDAVNFDDEDNVDALINSLKEMDPMLKFLEGIRTKHPIFGPVISQYKHFRNAIESQVRILLAPFNLIIGAVQTIFRFVG